MTLTSKQNIINAFDKAALTYDCCAHVQKNIATNLAADLIKLKNTPGSILEIGCGTGFLTQSLVSQFKDVPYYATDFAPLMVRSCQEKFKNIPKVHSFVMDGENPTLENNSDWICSSMAFQWFEDFEVSVRKLWQKTNVLAFTVPVDGTFQELHDVYKQFNYSARFRPFIVADTLYKLCRDLKPRNFQFQIQKEVEHFQNMLLFIKQLRNTGTQTPQSTYSQGNIRPLISYLSGGFSVTYQVAYCILEK
ncbi:MAG: methyltransferase domain-containing protein [Alphaproteobacteria bacterium]|jgi:malonyl-CoA O-methyltransferase|nr:methyltransferase domain-containing protein [Alphaproteobacteria bacterium]